MAAHPGADGIAGLHNALLTAIDLAVHNELREAVAAADLDLMAAVDGGQEGAVLLIRGLAQGGGVGNVPLGGIVKFRVHR